MKMTGDVISLKDIYFLEYPLFLFDFFAEMATV